MPGYAQEVGWKDKAERPTFLDKNKLRLLRPYQERAVHALQKAVGTGKDRFLFEMAGLGSVAHSILASVSVGIVNVLMTLVAVRLVDRVGRRPLLLWGLAGMIAGLALIGLSFHLPGLGHLQGLLAAGSLILYVGAFAVGLGPVFWLLISEIYPLSVRGLAMSVATLTNWGFNLLVTVSFLTLVHGLGLSWTFWAYGLVSVASWFFVKRFVPETKGRSLEQIENELDCGSKAA